MDISRAGAAVLLPRPGVGADRLVPRPRHGTGAALGTPLRRLAQSCQARARSHDSVARAVAQLRETSIDESLSAVL